MRSHLRAFAAGAGLLSIVGFTVAQQSGAKIAYVNSEALMVAAPGKTAADSALERMGAGLKAQLDKLQDSARSLVTKYQKEEPKLTQAQKDKYQKDLTTLENELQAKQQQAQQQFAARQQELYAPITDAVRKVIDDIRNEGGYSVIFDNAPGQGNIVAADKNLDITDKVVSRLKATPAPKINAAEPQKGAPTTPAGVTSRPPTRPPTQ
jgi:outer membrane protein